MHSIYADGTQTNECSGKTSGEISLAVIFAGSHRMPLRTTIETAMFSCPGGL
jgi:hypothetical protein